MNDIDFVFIKPDHGPERLESKIEIHFKDGLLAGLKLVGLDLWNSADGDLYVTFPARSFGVGTERRYFDYLRSGDVGGQPALRALKAAIIKAYYEQGHNSLDAVSSR